jgi:hypothetical protein
MRQKRKKVEAFVPMGKTRVRVGLPVRRSECCRKSAGGVLASNTLVRSAPKRVAVRVNGGLARGGSSARERRWPESSEGTRGRSGYAG